MAKLMLRPTQADYSVSDPEEYVATETRGGLPKTRRDLIGASRIIDVSWILNAVQYQYLIDFDAANLARNSEPFEVDLCIDSLEYRAYTVTIVPQSLVLNRQTGDAYMVNIKFECDTQNLVDGEDPLVVEADDGDEGNPGVGEPGPSGGGAGYFPPPSSTLEPFLYDEFTGDDVLEAREPDVGYTEEGWADVAGDASTIDGQLTSIAEEAPYIISARYGPDTPAAQTIIAEWVAEWVITALAEYSVMTHVAVISESVTIEATLGNADEPSPAVEFRVNIDGEDPLIIDGLLTLDWVPGTQYLLTITSQKNRQVFQVTDSSGGIYVLELAANLAVIPDDQLYVSTVLLEADTQAPPTIERISLKALEPVYGFLDNFNGSGVVTTGSHVPDIAPGGWRWRIISGGASLVDGNLVAGEGVTLIGRGGTYIGASIAYTVQFIYRSQPELVSIGTAFELTLRGAWGQILETVHVLCGGEGAHTVRLGDDVTEHEAAIWNEATDYYGELRINSDFTTQLTFLGLTLTGTLQNVSTFGEQWPYSFGAKLNAGAGLSFLAVVENARGGTLPVGTYCELSAGSPYDDEEYGIYVMDNFTGTNGDASTHSPDVGDWASIEGELLDGTLTATYVVESDSHSFGFVTDDIPGSFFEDPWRLDFRVGRFNVNIPLAFSGSIDGADQCYFGIEFVNETTVRAYFTWRFEDGPYRVIGPILIEKPFCQWIDFALVFAIGEVQMLIDGFQVGFCSYATSIETGAIRFFCTPTTVDSGGAVLLDMAPGDARLDCFMIRSLPPI